MGKFPIGYGGGGSPFHYQEKNKALDEVMERYTLSFILPDLCQPQRNRLIHFNVSCFMFDLTFAVERKYRSAAITIFLLCLVLFEKFVLLFQRHCVRFSIQRDLKCQ